MEIRNDKTKRYPKIAVYCFLYFVHPIVQLTPDGVTTDLSIIPLLPICGSNACLVLYVMLLYHHGTYLLYKLTL